VEIDVYKIIYTHEKRRPQGRRIPLNPLVGAAGIEPATLCLEGSFHHALKIEHFQGFLFQTDVGILLRRVESC
jgi:hypothetical protein